MPTPADRRKFGWALAGILAFGIAGVAGMARMIWVAFEKILSGQGLESYVTGWLVEFNYVGFLVLVCGVIVGLLWGIVHWIQEWRLVRSLEKKYGSTRSNT
jgi:uncharacterized metal-binding protein